MTRQEFLDSNWRRQRTTVANGTRVAIDLEKGQYEITPPPAR